jgi:hypothetical protein
VQLTTGRFSDLRLTSRLLPIRPRRTVDKTSLGFPTHIGADTHSGATVAASNRVPVWLSQSIALRPAVRLFSFQRATCRVSIRLPAALQTKIKNFSPQIPLRLTAARLSTLWIRTCGNRSRDCVFCPVPAGRMIQHTWAYSREFGGFELFAYLVYVFP